MPDREKVVRSVESCFDYWLAQHRCLLPLEMDKVRQMKSDALFLLKEHEAIPVDTKVIGTFNGDTEVYCCRDCRTILDPAFHYCPNCGQEVKWDD